MLNIGILPPWLCYILLLAGSGFSALFIALIIGQLIEKTKEYVADVKYEHKRKHRFDNPPIAKCYCKDCESWNSTTNMCWILDRCTADNSFCYEASPRKKDPDLK